MISDTTDVNWLWCIIYLLLPNKSDTKLVTQPPKKTTENSCNTNCSLVLLILATEARMRLLSQDFQQNHSVSTDYSIALLLLSLLHTVTPGIFLNHTKYRLWCYTTHGVTKNSSEVVKQIKFFMRNRRNPFHCPF